MQFRTEWIWVPLACLVTLWVLSSVQPACTWSQVMDTLNVQDRDQYTQLAVLGCALVAVIAIARFIRDGGKDS